MAAQYPPLHKADLEYCTPDALRQLTFDYFEDEASLALVVAELERRGFDPYA